MNTLLLASMSDHKYQEAFMAMLNCSQAESPHPASARKTARSMRSASVMK